MPLNRIFLTGTFIGWILSAATASAAIPVSKPFEFGVKFGATFTNTTGDWLSDVGGISVVKSGRLGWLAGALVSRNLGSHWAVQAETQYIQKGIKFSGSQDAGIYGIATVNGSIGVAYIEVPILVRFLLAEKTALKPSLYVGPVASFKTGLSLGAKATAGGFTVEVPPEDLAAFETELNNGMKSSDWGAAFGGSVRFGMIQMDLRYTLGLSDISNEPAEATAVTMKNTALQLTTGIVF